MGPEEVASAFGDLVGVVDVVAVFVELRVFVERVAADVAVPFLLPVTVLGGGSGGGRGGGRGGRWQGFEVGIEGFLYPLEKAFHPFVFGVGELEVLGVVESLLDEFPLVDFFDFCNF